MSEEKKQLLSINNISFAYPGDRIFHSVDLELNTGEILILMGPNGCGKTTLIDCLMGFKKLSEGQILLSGKPLNIHKHQEIAKQIAFVPQNHQKTFPYTVQEIVLMGRTPHIGFFGRPSDIDMAETKKAMRQMGILNLADREYTLLSGGELQLVMLARCLAQGSPLIIMDEPTSHLDFKNELIVLQAIASLVQREHKSAIIATHAPNHAFFFEKENEENVRVALMQRGEGIVETGLPRAMLTPDKIKDIYGIESAITSNPEHPELRQIVPLCCTSERTTPEDNNVQTAK